MKVLINGRFLDRPMSGVKRFAVETVMALDELARTGEHGTQGLDFEIVAPRETRTELPLRAIRTCRTGGSNGPLWEQVSLARHGQGGEWLINLCNSAPLLRRRQLVVIHDVATARVPHSYRFLFRSWYHLLIPSLYRRAQAVVTVSEFSRRELASLYGSRAGVQVIPEGTEHMRRIVPDRRILHARGLESRRYFLVVGSPARHKNLEVVVKALGLLQDDSVALVVAGQADPRVFSSYAYGNGCPVEMLGEVTDEELKALYLHASAFVFPSRYEGYGLPPTEAMACGCPAIVAEQEAVVATTGGAALYFAANDAAALAAQMRRVLNEPGLVEQLRAAGLARAQGLTWRETAARLLRCLGDPPEPVPARRPAPS